MCSLRLTRLLSGGRAIEGVNAIEFAMLLPIFIMLLVGIVEFGQLLFLQAALQHAVTFAARCATQFGQVPQDSNIFGATASPPDCTTQPNVQQMASNQSFGLYVPPSNFTAVLNTNGYNCVYANYPQTFVIPLITTFNITLTANSCYPSPVTG
jgi:Flp pilus assembly protein TadG